MVGLRRAGVLVLWTMAAAFVFASSGSSRVVGPPPPPSAYLDPVLYPATLRPDPRCAIPRSCTHAVITFTNPEKFTLNSFMGEITGNPFKSFKLDGEPPCFSTGGKFGPNFETAWMCLGLKIPPGGTITGSLIATKPLTPTTSARFDWSNKGSQGGMLPDYSHDIHYYWIAASPPTPAAKAVEFITEAIANENAAIKKLEEIHPNMTGTTEKDLRHATFVDIQRSATELVAASVNFEPVHDLAHDALVLDQKAADNIQHHPPNDSAAINDIVHALADKRDALAIAEKAAAKK